MSKINILHVIDKFSMDGKNPSSCALSFRDWSQHYDKETYNILFCSLKKPDPGGIMLKEHGNKVFYLNNGKYSFSNVTGLKRLMAREHIDLVHLHGYSSANFGRIAAWKEGIPAIVHEWAILKVQPHQYIMDFFLKNYTYRAIAVSGAVKEFMIKGRCIPADKIEIVYNSVALNHFQTIEPIRIKENRQVYGIPSDYKVVGTVTRLREEKGNRYLIEAVPIVLKNFPETVFLVVGDGPLREEMETLVKQLNIEKNVIFAGFCSNVRLMLSTFNLKVMASLSEGCPFALIEAMAMGKPIVATGVGGILEIIEHKKSGVLVPPKDPQKMADGIKYLLANESEAHRMGQVAKQESQKFSVEHIVRQQELIYEKVLSSFNSRQ